MTPPPEGYGSAGSWRSDTRELVELIYAALQRMDVGAVTELVDAWFAPDAAVVEPAWVIEAGRYEGIDRVKRMFAEVASPGPPVDAAKLVVDRMIEAVAESDRLDHVVAEISFPVWTPGSGDTVPVRAVHWWTFKELKVSEIRTYYWNAGFKPS